MLNRRLQSTHVKMPQCWQSHVVAQLLILKTLPVEHVLPEYPVPVQLQLKLLPLLEQLPPLLQGEELQ